MQQRTKTNQVEGNYEASCFVEGVLVLPIPVGHQCNQQQLV